MNFVRFWPWWYVLLLWFVNISAGNLCLYDFGGDAARIAGIEEPVALTTHGALYIFFPLLLIIIIIIIMTIIITVVRFWKTGV